MNSIKQADRQCTKRTHKPNKGNHLPFVRRYKTVSYTHLDVYKRQRLLLRRLHACLNTLGSVTVYDFNRLIYFKIPVCGLYSRLYFRADFIAFTQLIFFNFHIFLMFSYLQSKMLGYCAFFAVNIGLRGYSIVLSCCHQKPQTHCKVSSVTLLLSFLSFSLLFCWSHIKPGEPSGLLSKDICGSRISISQCFWLLA